MKEDENLIRFVSEFHSGVKFELVTVLVAELGDHYEFVVVNVTLSDSEDWGHLLRLLRCQH